MSTMSIVYLCIISCRKCAVCLLRLWMVTGCRLQWCRLQWCRLQWCRLPWCRLQWCRLQWCRLQRCRLQTAGCKLQAANYRLQTAGCKLQPANCSLQAVWCRLQTDMIKAQCCTYRVHCRYFTNSNIAIYCDLRLRVCCIWSSSNDHAEITSIHGKSVLFQLIHGRNSLNVRTIYFILCNIDFYTSNAHK